MIKFLMLLAACVFAVGAMSAQAATPLQLTSNVFVEKQIIRADGSRSVVLVKPDLVVPGDDLIFVVKFRNIGTATANNFVITNPLPPAVAFNGTADGSETVSVDGGASWGVLAKLRVKQPNGTLRAAERSDVTHIKWNLNQPLTAGAEGKLIFRGVVK